MGDAARYGRRRTEQELSGRCQELNPAHRRHRVPGPPVEFSPAGLRRPAAPLLEEERDVLVLAAITQVAHPRRVNAPVSRTGLATGDQPVDATEVEPCERAEQRLGGYE